MIQTEEHKILKTTLPVGFVPGPMDVIYAQGKRAFRHQGNCHYRSIIKSNLPQYSTAETRSEKSHIVTHIMDTIRGASSSGLLFVKQMKDGRWYEITEGAAREKISQSFRDLLHVKYSSSSKAKYRRRKTKKEDSTSLAGSSEQTSSVKRVSPSANKNKTKSPADQISCSNLNNSKGERQEHKNSKSVDKEQCDGLNFSNSEGKGTTVEECSAVFEKPTIFSSLQNDDEPIPIHQENFSVIPRCWDDDEPIPLQSATLCGGCDLPLVSDETTFDESGKSALCSNKLSFCKDAFISDRETKNNHEQLSDRSQVGPKQLQLSLSLSSEPIPVDQTEVASDCFYSQSMSHPEELLLVMASLWE